MAYIHQPPGGTSRTLVIPLQNTSGLAWSYARKTPLNVRTESTGLESEDTSRFFDLVSHMFDLQPYPSATIRPLQKDGDIQLGPGRGLPAKLLGLEAEYLVEVTGPNDPADAKSWSRGRKLKVSLILALNAFVASWGSSGYSPALVAVEREFAVSRELAILGITLYVVGFATGPVAFGPLSELYGRRWPLTVACFFLTCFMFGAGSARDIQTLMLCRFFAGAFAGCPLAVVGGALADLYGNESRGLANGGFSLMTFTAPFLSPIGSAFLTKSLGWRINQYIAGAMSAVTFILDFCFLEETYEQTLLRKRAAEIRRNSGNFAIHHTSEEEILTMSSFFQQHLFLPLRLLFQEPIILLVTLYTAFLYGILYLFLVAYPIVFVQVRGIDPTIATLPYFGVIVGVLIGCAMIIAFESRYVQKVRANNGQPVPEERLIAMMLGAILFPVGLLWFTWTGHYARIHWIVPTISGLFTGCAFVLLFLQAMNYIVDAYLSVAASAIAANTILRSIVGSVFPLFASKMFVALGVRYAGTVLGGLAILFMPIPFCFYVYGARLRGMSRYLPQVEAEKQGTLVTTSDLSDPEIRNQA